MKFLVVEEKNMHYIRIAFKIVNFMLLYIVHIDNLLIADALLIINIP